MTRKSWLTQSLLCAVLFFGGRMCEAANLGPNLTKTLQGVSDSANVGVVIVAFNTNSGLNATHLAVLTSAGILKGSTLQRLGMVAFPATAGQVRKLAQNPSVRSIWSNDRLYYFDNQTRTLTGVDRVRTDADFTHRNSGMPVTGQGNFAVVINDSGIDATHPDLHYPEHVVQNVQILADTETVSGFTPLVFLENVPNTDSNVGHGTHCAGIVGGTGSASGGLYSGVAPGAKLIGTGSGAGLFVLNALGGFEWSIANQSRYNIRVISNSWGNSGAFDPEDPTNIATKLAHDLNIVVVFAAGNSGPGKNTLNGYAKAPWVIGVAAGTKEGGLASFSSRGTPGQYAPTLTAPGTGREFASNAAKFSAAVISARAKSNIFANGLTDDAELSPAYLPFYTQISGTSMATPFVAGTAALLLSADITLTPDQVKDILVQTVSQMPGFSSFEVGAGYINVYAAVDKAFNRSKNYGTYGGPLDRMTFNTKLSVSGPAAASFHIDYNPAATPGAGSANSKTFTVDPNMTVLDVFATIDNAATTGDGNTIGLLLTDPNGTKYSSGVALPILDSPSREVVVQNPVAGQWLLEIRGVRGLAALPNVSLPTSGAALPGPVDGTITQQQFTILNALDVQGHAAQAQIEFALKNRYMDVYQDGMFRPETQVSRQDLAQSLVLNTPLRQSLGATIRFYDWNSGNDAIPQAIIANGSTLRDYDFTPAGMMTPMGSQFGGMMFVQRIDVAVALVRALGLDAEARAKAGSDVTVNYSGQTLTLTDNADIPADLRGYVQFALDKGILQGFYSLEQSPYDQSPTLKARVKPGDALTRAFLAYALAHYRQSFAAGN